MKYASLVISSLALILSIYLFVSFSGSSKETPSKTEAGVATGEAPNIVFVYADTVYTQYKEFADQQAALETRQMAAEKQLQQRAQALEAEVTRVQRQVQQGLLTPNQIAGEEHRIGRQQQEMMMEREQLAQELMTESQALTEKLQTKIKKTLDEIREEYGYDYILSYGPGTGVIMVNDAYDITDVLLDRLNNSAPATPPADTTDSE